LATLFFAVSAPLAGAGVLISEIMFRPPGVPEPVEKEWLELHNPDFVAADVSGWRLTNGVTYTMPNGVVIPAGGYLVVAADPVAFAAAYPGFGGAVVGGWVGRLANSGEDLRLVDAAGTKVDEVSYADDGDWALRARSALSYGHHGWEWISGADGTGRSLELRNPALGNGSGQNWGASLVAGGTPGAVNSLASSDVAPLIKDANHRPAIPSSATPIVVSAEIEDENGSSASLHWRLDGGAWQTLPMSDADGDGKIEASIPAQPNLTIIEWYISATDGVNTRTWPAPVRTSNPGEATETFGQVANALVQVDNSYNATAAFLTAADSPIYRLVMTAAERATLQQLQTTSGQQLSEAAFNATFVSHDGSGVKVRTLCSVRNRGFGSALGPPNNFQVSFLSSDPWNDRRSFGLNCRFPYAQVLGAALFQRAGLAVQDSAIVRLRVNGVDLAETGGRMYGRYNRQEGRNAAWAERHYPNDPDGNLYRLDDHAPGTVGTPPGNLGSGEFLYEGTDPLSYSDTFIKDTNAADNDYSDLIQFTRVVSAPATGGTAEQPAISNAAYPAAVSAVLDLEQFYRYIATDTLIGNIEGGLSTGRADDVSIYRGIVDPRFRFVPHDLDTIFDIGDSTGAVTRNIFSYDGGNSPGTGVLGLTRLFNHPELVPRYYAALLEAMDTWFNSATIDPIVEQIMAGWVPLTDSVAQNRSINDIKAYVANRRASVLGQIQQNYSLNVTTGVANTNEGYFRTNTGAATLSGTFHVAKTYSITVNGQLANWSYRTATAGTWSYAVPAGGGTVLRPGLNNVVVNFWDAPNGTGNILQSLTATIYYGVTGTTVSGTLTAGSLRLTAPSSYVPGKPMLARVQLLDAAGNVNRAAWDTTVTLSSNVAGIALPTVRLFNGEGSGLIVAGGGSGGTTQLIPPGGTSGAPNASAPDWRMLDTGPEPATTWKSNLAFDDSAWTLGKLQAGAGDGDERTVLNNVAGSATNTRRAFYFRRVFQVTDPAAYASLILRAVIDDGAVFYLNGVEVLRDNMPAGTPTLTTPASANRAGTAETQLRVFDISAFRNLLVAGDNLLAVQVHNYSLGTTYSADLSFDCQLEGVAPAADPGNFTLIATGGGFAAQKVITSLGSAPAFTNVSGSIVADATWSGNVRVTGDVTVAAGVTLSIDPGTHIFLDGDATPGSTGGTRIIVNGAVQANGTAANPINISAFQATDRWGGFVFSNAAPSTWNYVLLSYAGHTTGVGHTSRGPMVRLTASNLSLLDCVLADGPAKAIYSSGLCDLVLRRTLIERMITGPELGDGAALLCEDTNIQQILPHFRESNASVPDDEDCLYVHNNSGRSVIIRRSVFALCGDDVFDCLGGPIVVEDSILRDGWDKGMSLLNNDLTITRTQIIRCDKAIVPKSQNADTRTVTATHCTIVSENHDTTLAPWGYSVPPSSPDPDTPSTGFWTQNKSGQSHPAATLAIQAKNCIILAESPVLIDAPYPAGNTAVTYSDLARLDFSAFVWPGLGNISADPLFTDAAAGDFHLTAGSPCRDSGDPAMFDPDTTRADMGALPFAAGGGISTITWTAANGPYLVTANATVPVGTTLVVQAGTNVQFGQNVRLTVRGTLQVLGTPDARVVFSHVPGTIASGDCDPIKLGTQTGPPKWGGIRVVDSMATENVVKYADFINAQGTDPATSENYGSLGFIRSWGWAEGLTFAGTHLRMLYGRNAKLTIVRCVFPDMFIFDPVLNRIEEPTTDFIASADNRMEPLKVEYPTTDPEVSGANAVNFPNGLPLNGHFRVYYNQFNGNRGHQDVFDAESGRWAPRNASGQQTNGQFVLDCRYNHFRGRTGDEHIDLGGDAYIASNIFENARKDFWTNDTGYSSAISSGDKGSGTTIMVARNVCFDLDHVINLKASTATIFEHNTVADLHADYQYVGQSVTQNIICAPVNFFIPGDGASPTHGDGAYLGYNIISNVPHVFSGADASASGPITTKIEFFHNLLDQIGDPVIGPNHPGGFFSGTYGPNVAGSPDFINPAAKNYGLRQGSSARGLAPGGIDYGATVEEWAYLHGGPRGTVNATSASFTIGGPGLVAYKWRLDGGAWSAPVPIGDGGLFSRTQPCVRQAVLNLTGLAAGTHTLEVLGQDMAGNWQDADPARSLAGLAQAAPTLRRWIIDPAVALVRINEILAASATLADTIELHNPGSGPVNLGGWSLTDDPAQPAKYSIPVGTTIPAGGYLAFSTAQTGIALDKDGDAVYLYQGAVLRDAVVFGHQIADLTLGRAGAGGEWSLCVPTLGSANVAQRTGDLGTIRINEWFSDGEVLYENDWIELLNTGPLPVDLSGVRLTDQPAGDAANTVLPPYSYIAAGGCLKLSASKELSFGLDAQQESITLFAPSGAMLDTVAFYPQTTDYSMVRTGSGYGFRELPTGGFEMAETDPVYLNALAILRGLRITEIMFNAIGGNDYEYVVLRNVRETPFDLAGARFVAGIDFTFGPLVLNPGQAVVVVKNPARFIARYGSGPLIAGTYSGNLDNDGERLALQLPPPFDANVLSFDYRDGWYVSTDGLGTALVVVDPLVSAREWGQRGTWMATVLGGHPAGFGARADTYSGWSALHGAVAVTSDDDRDGVAALVEYALGMDPRSPNGGDGRAGAPLVVSGANGRAALYFLVPQNAAAAQGHGLAEATYRVQASSDLTNWTTIATKSLTAAWSGVGAVTFGTVASGFLPVTVEDIVPPGSQPRRALRLHLTWVP
jgi:hypothetical protein